MHSLGYDRQTLQYFARHGFPKVIVSDRGSPFDSDEWLEFASKYDIELRTSSARHPQSNGLAEKAVQIAKGILNKCEDPNIGLLASTSSRLNAAFVRIFTG